MGDLSHSGSKDETDGQRMILCKIERETSSVWKGQVCVKGRRLRLGVVVWNKVMKEVEPGLGDYALTADQLKCLQD